MGIGGNNMNLKLAIVLTLIAVILLTGCNKSNGTDDVVHVDDAMKELEERIAFLEGFEKIPANVEIEHVDSGITEVCEDGVARDCIIQFRVKNLGENWIYLAVGENLGESDSVNERLWSGEPIAIANDGDTWGFEIEPGKTSPYYSVIILLTYMEPGLHDVNIPLYLWNKETGKKIGYLEQDYEVKMKLISNQDNEPTYKSDRTLNTTAEFDSFTLYNWDESASSFILIKDADIFDIHDYSMTVIQVHTEGMEFDDELVDFIESMNADTFIVYPVDVGYGTILKRMTQKEALVTWKD